MDRKLTTTATQALQITSLGNGEELPVATEFVYNPADPYAITLLLQTEAGMVGWSFARELLAAGVYEPSGDGDVHIWPCLGAQGEAVVIIELNNETESTLLQFPTRQVNDFIAASLEAIPFGAESALVDVDTWLKSVLR